MPGFAGPATHFTGCPPGRLPAYARTDAAGEADLARAL